MLLQPVFLLSLLALGAEAAPRTKAPAGSKIVAKCNGDYNSLQAAINSIDKASTETTNIFIRPGNYSGQTIISSGHKGKIAIYGYTADDQTYTENRVALSFNLSSATAGSNAASGTIRINSPNVSLYNILVENTAGDAGPAHAISIDGDRLGFYGCAFTGWQDTMFGANTNSVFKNSYVEGAVDFIYGGKNANFWFESTDIGFSRANGGYITASGRDSADAAWYIFNKARVFAKAGVNVASKSVFLGRPWRAWARTVFQNSELSGIIKAEGWNPWDKGADLSNIVYAEYNNTGPGADTSKRVPWAKMLDNPMDINLVMPEWTQWVDLAYWNESS